MVEGKEFHRFSDSHPYSSESMKNENAKLGLEVGKESITKRSEAFKL
jgi:hypothetical protein